MRYISLINVGPNLNRRIVEPDDVIVKVKVGGAITSLQPLNDDVLDFFKLAALCGSDLHIYRGVEGVDKMYAPRFCNG